MGYLYPPVGALYHGNNKTTFRIWAPTLKKVDLELNQTRHSMTADERGYWSLTIEASPGSLYSFVLDSEKKLPDPASRCQPEGVHGPSEVVDPSFIWNDSNWKGIALSEMIIYELHTGTFSAAHTFQGIIDKLDYLLDLGVNAIELMPVGQFPGSRNWGYDGVYPFAVQFSYGGVHGLKNLVNAAHQKGVAIILDVVYNHQGPEGNYLAEFAPYFTDKYKTGWGKAINFDDEYCDGVRHFYWQNALMWLDEFHIDGLRLDAVHAIWDNSAYHFIDELRVRVRELEAKTGRKKVLIAEFDLNNPRYISSPEQGGYGLDGQWIDEFHHALHSVVTGEVDGYYEDFGKTEHLAKALKDCYVYTGEYSVHRKKHFGKYPDENPYSQFVVFAQNHDQIGNRMLGDRLAQTLGLESLKLTAAAYLLAPQVPMIFMGEEYGEKNPFQYFISHGDSELVELIRKGRKAEFSYFKWEGELPDPQSEKTFEACVLSWSCVHDETSKTLFKFYQHLIRFRKTNAAMKNSARDSVKVLPSLNERVIAFERNSKTDRLLIILNFNKSSVVYELPPGSKVLFDSSDSEWAGTGKVKTNDNTFKLNAESAVILQLN